MASVMDVNEFAVAFTIAVTEVSDPAIDFVAKNGRYSIFSILQGIFPQARESFFSNCYCFWTYRKLKCRIQRNLTSMAILMNPDSKEMLHFDGSGASHTAREKLLFQ
jgi:hypothetical protein